MLDVPVGSGRFLPLYEELGVGRVTGVDSSEEMLALARRKRVRLKRLDLSVGDAARLPHRDRSYDVVVCVRFLDLIDEDGMRRVLSEICRVARHAVILTIRLGPAYQLKVNTAVHDERRFRRLYVARGWHAAEEAPVFRQGWRVIKLVRQRAR